MASIRSSFVLVCLALASRSCASEDTSQQYVTKVCNQKLRNIDSIAKFKEFMGHYRGVTISQNEPKRVFLNLDNCLRKCFSLKDTLFELEQIIDSRNEGVCHMSYINKLIEFKVKYLLDLEESDNKNLDKIDSKSSYIATFFTIYAYQVAYYCKKQLPLKLEEAQREQDCSKILAEMTPDLLDDKADDQEDAIKIATALLSESRVENFIPVMHLKHLHLPVAHIDVMVQNSAVERLKAIREECNKIEPYYTASLSPIGALAQFGYDTESLPTDWDNKSEDRLKCWLGAAQLCQGILRTHLKVSDKMEIDPNSDSKFITVELEGSPTDLPAQSEGEIVYKDSFEEFAPAVLKLAKKRLTFSSKMKWKVSNVVKRFIERRIDIRTSQEGALRGLLDFIKSMDNDVDKKVSFGGKEIRSKAFNPTAVATDNADAIIRTASPFANKEVGFLMSCVVGVVMTAVFVYLSVYMCASALKHQQYSTDGHSKSDWRKLRDAKVKKVEAKLTGKKRNVFGMHVYKPEYN